MNRYSRYCSEERYRAARYEDTPCVWHDLPKRRVLSTRNPRFIFSKVGLGTKAKAIALIGLVCLVGVITCFGLGNYSDALIGKAGISTPEGQWKKGEMPYLYQTDEAWGGKPYAGDTVSESGCGPTCMTMAYIYLTGNRDYDPAKMAAFAERGGYVDSGMTSWLFMTDGAARLGLSSSELPNDAGSVRQAIESGHPVIASVSKGDFTTTGHFIVLCGIASDGEVLIRDPNSADRSAKSWNLERVLAQSRNLWELSRP